MANVQPGPSIKHLRRDQLLDNYEAAAKTLQTLIRAKESEIAYRKDLIKMLEDSKTYHDSRLLQAKQEYHTAKSHLPEGIDLKSKRSTTPPLPPPLTSQPPPTPSSIASSGHSSETNQIQAQPTSQSSNKSSDSEMLAHGGDSRGSLDRRLSEFLKTFPGMAPPSHSDQQQTQQQQLTKPPTPGYYTQQPTMPAIQMLAAPPSIELLRFPPPFFPRNDRNTN